MQPNHVHKVMPDLVQIIKARAGKIPGRAGIDDNTATGGICIIPKANATHPRTKAPSAGR